MSQSKAQLTNPLGTVNITDGVNVTGVITATTLIGDGTALTGIALTGNINTSGIITASEFYGYGGDLDNVGLSTTGSINTTGIITASAFYGDGSGLTGIGGDLTVLTFSPISGATEVDPGTNIVLTFNRPIKRGTGTITLRTDSATGTIIESFDASTSPLLSINAGELTINPTSDLSITTNYYLVFPAGTITDEYYSPNSLIDTYNFTTATTLNKLFSWGSNSYGDGAQNDLIRRSSPVQIPGVKWSFMGSGRRYTVGAIKTDGTLWTWSYNANYGEAGVNSRAVYAYSSPVQIPGTSWSSISSGNFYSLAKKTDGTLWAWGWNNRGELGQNNRTNISSPVQIPGTSWDTFRSGNYFSIATKTDGTLWAWGVNNYAQLGQNSSIPCSSPTQIPGTQWNINHGTGFGHAVVTKTDGTLWVWGRNSDAQLGQNNLTPYSSPRQIPGTQWNKVAGGYGLFDNTIATKTDGTLWALGRNANAELGLNDTVAYSSPRQIPGTQWNLVSCGFLNGFATKTDGTLWAWGLNSGAQGGVLGQNNITTYSSPIQIPGTQWTSVSTSYAATFATKTE
jgi:alpha-tubulin suppressor-like RCC1 family protein